MCIQFLFARPGPHPVELGASAEGMGNQKNQDADCDYVIKVLFHVSSSTHLKGSSSPANKKEPGGHLQFIMPGL